MHLIRVDLPAPLSPTRAITSPSRTSKSTSVNACTEPNDLEIRRSSRSGVSLTVANFLPHHRWRRPMKGASHMRHEPLLAELRELADADVALLEELVPEEPRVIGLRNRDDRQLDRRLLLAAVLAEPVDAGDLLVLQH